MTSILLFLEELNMIDLLKSEIKIGNYVRKEQEELEKLYKQNNFIKNLLQKNKSK